MIIKGHSSTGRGLGTYLLKDKNDRIEEWGVRGDMSRDLKETLNDWRSDSLGTSCSKPLYHAQINPDHRLNREEWEKAIQIFEQEMGFQRQPRAIVLHEFKGREHLHLVYSRIDDNGQAISDSWNYVHHEKAAREIEKTLGLEKTPGVFIDRDGKRPDRTPSHAAIQQGKHLGLSPRIVKKEISKFYQETEQEAGEFVKTLQDRGYTLTQGNRKTFVIIDSFGGVHNLARLINVKVSELRDILSDCDFDKMPSLKEIQHEKRQDNILSNKHRAKAEKQLHQFERENQKDPELSRGMSL